MPIQYIADAEKDANMKSLSQEEAIAILSDMKIDIPVPKAAVTQIKRNVALDMAISALSCSEIPNSSDSISRQAAIDALDCINGVEEVLRSLPSAQPKSYREGYQAGYKDAQSEIIRCRECKYNNMPPTAGNAGCTLLYGMTNQNGFCSLAERREDKA